MCFSQHTPAHDLNITNGNDLFMHLPFIALHEFFEANANEFDDMCERGETKTK